MENRRPACRAPVLTGSVPACWADVPTTGGVSLYASARILLNSKSSQHPNGLGNSSGLIGKYLHDSTGASRSAFIPAMMDRKAYNEDGVGGMHVYTPWWLDNKNLDFPRGYHMEIWQCMGRCTAGCAG